MSKIVALDYGRKRIGVAVSDESEQFAFGKDVIDASGDVEVDAQQVARTCAALEADLVVVGQPLTLDGRDSFSAEKARAFAEHLAAASGLPVELWDERMTSALAEKAMIEGGARRDKRRRRRDMVAAQLILQSFLDRRRSDNARAASANRPVRRD